MCNNVPIMYFILNNSHIYNFAQQLQYLTPRRKDLIRNPYDYVHGQTNFYKIFQFAPHTLNIKV